MIVPIRLLRAAEHHDKKSVHDVELAGGRAGRADHREGRAGDAGDAAAEPECEAIDAARIDADGAAHHAVGDDRAHLQPPARLEHQQRHDARDDERQPHHEQSIDLHFNGLGDRQRAHHPLRQLNSDFAGAENRTERLLHDEAQAPGRKQQAERTRIEMPYQRPFDQEAERPGDDERQSTIATKK